MPFSIQVPTALCATLLPLLTTPVPAAESIEILDSSLEKILSPDSKIETLCTGFTWAEGPVWHPATESLLFSDVPKNTVYQWKEGQTAATIFLNPSGFTGNDRGGNREPGSNGLALDSRGRLLSCEHGDRRVSVLTEKGGKMTVADNYQGKRFNSPNDLAVHPSGAIYFTDPPYGSAGDDYRELDYCGVFRIDPDGTVALLLDDLPRPNGVALSPDGTILYVAQSHRPAPVIMRYPIKVDGSLGKGTVLFNTKDLEGPGLPDGLKVHPDGTIITSGPDGVLFLSPNGKLLGRIRCGRNTANVALGPAHLYITSKDRLLRVPLKGL